MISKSLIVEPGNLPHRLQIQKLPDTAAAVNSFGETYAGTPTGSPSVIATVYAFIKQLTGDELLAAQQQIADVTHKIQCRYRPGITPKMIGLFQGRTFQFLRVDNTEERNRVLWIWAKEQV